MKPTKNKLARRTLSIISLLALIGGGIALGATIAHTLTNL